MDKLIALLNARRQHWAKIAARAGVAYTTVARAARGESSPTLKTAEKIMAAARRFKPS